MKHKLVGMLILLLLSLCISFFLLPGMKSFKPELDVKILQAARGNPASAKGDWGVLNVNNNVYYINLVGTQNTIHDAKNNLLYTGDDRNTVELVCLRENWKKINSSVEMNQILGDEPLPAVFFNKREVIFVNQSKNEYFLYKRQ
jgi:hypothetical protein